MRAYKHDNIACFYNNVRSLLNTRIWSLICQVQHFPSPASSTWSVTFQTRHFPLLLLVPSFSSHAFSTCWSFLALSFSGPVCIFRRPRKHSTLTRPWGTSSLSLQPAYSRRDNWKLFFSRTHFLSFSSILIVYRVLEAFSLNATLTFTFNNNNNNNNNNTVMPTWTLRLCRLHGLLMFAAAYRPQASVCLSVCLWACLWVRFFTALHVMQTRYSDENSVRLSVRLSVCHSHACIVTKWKKDLSTFLHHTKDNLA